MLKSKEKIYEAIKCFLSYGFNRIINQPNCLQSFRGYGQTGGGKPDKGFKNARGDNVWTCDGAVIKDYEGAGYLQQNGLPLEIKGNFICDGDKPVLPKDCQGKEIHSEAEFIAFWQKHQVPIGLKDFKCVNGVPTIPNEDLEYWKRTEKINPTCKDARGRKRPCV